MEEVRLVDPSLLRAEGGPPVGVVGLEGEVDVGESMEGRGKAQDGDAEEEEEASRPPERDRRR